MKLRLKQAVPVSRLDSGRTFLWEDKYWMKLAHIRSDPESGKPSVFCANVQTGTCRHLDPNEHVKHVELEAVEV